MAEMKWLNTSYPHPDALPPERWEKTGVSRNEYLRYYEAMVRERADRDKSAPGVGDPAPDFEIDHLTPAGRGTGKKFRLSSARGRPVALVFGSYT